MIIWNGLDGHACAICKRIKSSFASILKIPDKFVQEEPISGEQTLKKQNLFKLQATHREGNRQPSWIFPSSIKRPRRTATASSVRSKSPCCAVTHAISPLVITPVAIASRNNSPKIMEQITDWIHVAQFVHSLQRVHMFLYRANLKRLGTAAPLIFSKSEGKRWRHFQAAGCLRRQRSIHNPSIKSQDKKSQCINRSCHYRWS